MAKQLHKPTDRRMYFGFANLPTPRLEELRDRYLHLYASDPLTAHYSAAALAEIDAAITAARLKGGA